MGPVRSSSRQRRDSRRVRETYASVTRSEVIEFDEQDHSASCAPTQTRGLQSSPSSLCDYDTPLSPSSSGFERQESPLTDLDEFETSFRQAPRKNTPSKLLGSVTILGETLQFTTGGELLIEWIVDRQELFLNRFNGLPRSQWTDNPILKEWKFCNVYRVLDYSCQFLIREVIDHPRFSQDPVEMIFRILVFSLFNKGKTWKELCSRLIISWATYNQEEWLDVLDEIHDLPGHGGLYTNAYQIPAPPLNSTHRSTVRFHICQLIPDMMASLPEVIREADYAADIYEYLITHPTIADFMGNQILLNLSYASVPNAGGKFHPDDLIVPGKGCVKGIERCFSSSIEKARRNVPGIDRYIVRWLVNNQDSLLSKAARGKWRPLVVDGTCLPLRLEDMEHVLCELDKYCRVVWREQEQPKHRYIPRTDNVSARHPTAVLPKSYFARIQLPPNVGNSPQGEDSYIAERISRHRYDDDGDVQFLVHWLYWDADEGDPTWQYRDAVPQASINQYRDLLRRRKMRVDF